MTGVQTCALPIYRHIATTLCQGAALHYVNKKNGIKDFDVWFFYAEHSKLTYPYRALKKVDSKLVKFGRSSRDIAWSFEGRRVDLMGREIDSDIIKSNNHDPITCIREYLTRSRTESATKLAEKAVVGLHPNNILGKVIWPISR